MLVTLATPLQRTIEAAASSSAPATSRILIWRAPLLSAISWRRRERVLSRAADTCALGMLAMMIALPCCVEREARERERYFASFNAMSMRASLMLMAEGVREMVLVERRRALRAMRRYGGGVR